MTDNRNLVTASLTAHETGTPALQLPGGGTFDYSISNTFSATVTLQRRRRGETSSDWHDWKSFSAAAEGWEYVGGAWEVRLYINNGDYTSGTADCELNAEV